MDTVASCISMKPEDSNALTAWRLVNWVRCLGEDLPQCFFQSLVSMVQDGERLLWILFCHTIFKDESQSYWNSDQLRDDQFALEKLVTPFWELPDSHWSLKASKPRTLFILTVKKNAIMLILAQSPNMSKLMQNRSKRVVKGQVLLKFWFRLHLDNPKRSYKSLTPRKDSELNKPMEMSVEVSLECGSICLQSLSRLS